MKRLGDGLCTPGWPCDGPAGGCELARDASGVERRRKDGGREGDATANVSRLA